MFYTNFCSHFKVIFQFSGQNKHESALQCLQMAKEFLSRFPKEVSIEIVLLLSTELSDSNPSFILFLLDTVN